jgi:hypothetical protein
MQRESPGRTNRPSPHQDSNSNNYGRALLSVPPQAIAPNLHICFLNVYTQIANKMGFQQKKITWHSPHRQRKITGKYTYILMARCLATKGWRDRQQSHFISIKIRVEEYKERQQRDQVYTKFWEELIAYSPSIWHGPHRERNRREHKHIKARWSHKFSNKN